MMTLLAIVAFIIILGVLVFVHELGHFVAAKRSGMRVDEFGFGFPPRLFGIKRGETTYSINLIPLGGFVKIVGEDGGEATDVRSFGNKPAWQRAIVLIAGVAMNAILAWFLISLALGLGLPSVVGENEQLGGSAKIRNVSIGILDVQAGSPADIAGIKPGDTISKINFEPIISVQQVQDATKVDAGKPTVYTIKRGKEVFEKTLTPRVNPPAGQGALGVGLASVGYVSYPWYIAPIKGFVAVYNLVALTVTTLIGILGQVFRGQHVSAALSGPIGIAILTKDVTQLGFVYLVQFTAVLSINLAIINIIPFPALDGGRVLFLFIEKIRRKKMSISTEQWINTAGFLVLIGLMVLVTFMDVSRYSSKFHNLYIQIKNIL